MGPAVRLFVRMRIRGTTLSTLEVFTLPNASSDIIFRDNSTDLFFPGVNALQHPFYVGSAAYVGYFLHTSLQLFSWGSFYFVAYQKC